MISTSSAVGGATCSACSASRFRCRRFAAPCSNRARSSAAPGTTGLMGAARPVAPSRATIRNVACSSSSRESRSATSQWISIEDEPVHETRPVMRRSRSRRTGPSSAMWSTAAVTIESGRHDGLPSEA